MRAWIRGLDAPGCYERAARAERKSALQGSGLVRTIGPCAQTLMPRTIATAKDALLNDQHKSAAHFKRPAKQALALATEPQGLFFIIPVSSSVATFKQSENVAIAYLVGARATASKFMSLPSTHAHGMDDTGGILIMHTSHVIP